jgi:hypothetical protein
MYGHVYAHLFQLSAEYSLRRQNWCKNMRNTCRRMNAVRLWAANSLPTGKTSQLNLFYSKSPTTDFWCVGQCQDILHNFLYWVTPPYHIDINNRHWNLWETLFPQLYILWSKICDLQLTMVISYIESTLLKTTQVYKAYVLIKWKACIIYRTSNLFIYNHHPSMRTNISTPQWEIGRSAVTIMGTSFP